MIAHYNPSVDYFTFKAIKLMARASFNIQKMMPIAILNPEDLKVYGEVDLLGVKNYPGVYDDRTERMPIMLGVNLPTFRLLNTLSFEVEYFRNGNPDDMGSQQAKLNPAYAYNAVPDNNSQDNGGGLGNKPNAAQQDYYSVLLKDDFDNHRDDWKWTLYAVKQVITGISVRASSTPGTMASCFAAFRQSRFTYGSTMRRLSCGVRRHCGAWTRSRLRG